MIIDAFLFYEEYDILELRLRLLYDRVDTFVILESDRTFSDKPKPYNLEACRSRFAWADSKIVYFKHHEIEREVHDGGTYWSIEFGQRDAIVAACAGLPDDATFILSDVDEIPSHEAIEWFGENPNIKLAVCQQNFFYYDLRFLRRSDWPGSVITRLSTARAVGANQLRHNRTSFPQIASGGWHLSYFGDAAAIRSKIGAFSHQEYNQPEYTDDAHINRCLDSGSDIFRREAGLTPVPPTFFPDYFRACARDFSWGKAL